MQSIPIGEEYISQEGVGVIFNYGKIFTGQNDTQGFAIALLAFFMRIFFGMVAILKMEVYTRVHKLYHNRYNCYDTVEKLNVFDD